MSYKVRLADQVQLELETSDVLTPQVMVEKYNGARFTGVRKPSSERIIDKEVCPTDPDTSPMQSSGGGSAVMGYSDHYIVDGGKSRNILWSVEKGSRK